LGGGGSRRKLAEGEYGTPFLQEKGANKKWTKKEEHGPGCEEHSIGNYMGGESKKEGGSNEVG